MLEYVALSLGGVSMESLRKSFVEFHIDFPVVTSPEAKSIRKGLISEANQVYHKLVGLGNDLPWSEASEDLFSADVSVLSILRSVVDQRTARPSEPVDVACLLGGHNSGVFVLQLASVLDQLNLIDISAQILTYYKNHEHLLPLNNRFVFRINQTVGSRNPMKGKFFSDIKQQAAPSDPVVGLDRFRQKLSKMLLFKQRRDTPGYTEYEPVDSDDTSPAAIYFQAMRNAQPRLNDNVKKFDIGMRPRVGANVGVNVDSTVDANVEANVKVDANVDSNVAVDVDTELNTHVRPFVATSVQPDANVGVQTGSESLPMHKPHVVAKPQLYTHVEPHVEPHTNVSEESFVIVKTYRHIDAKDRQLNRKEERPDVDDWERQARSDLDQILNST